MLEGLEIVGHLLSGLVNILDVLELLRFWRAFVCLVGGIVLAVLSYRFFPPGDWQELAAILETGGSLLGGIIWEVKARQ